MKVIFMTKFTELMSHLIFRKLAWGRLGTTEDMPDKLKRG